MRSTSRVEILCSWRGTSKCWHSNSAGIVSDNTIFEAAAVDRRTADAYQRLLANLFVLDVVPAWLTSRLSRLVKTPKRYVTDASLVAAALRMDARGVLRDGDLLGRVLDTSHRPFGLRPLRSHRCRTIASMWTQHP